MKDKVLVIVCGSSDPSLPEQKKRYSLVENEALNKGYGKIEYVSWNQFNPINLQIATEYLNKKLIKLENEKICYDVIAFSWGCSVCLNTFYSKEKPENIGNTVLWGILEFWRLAGFFIPNNKTEGSIKYLCSKNFHIDSTFLSFQIPNELIVANYPHNNKIKICCGDKDPDSTPNYINYLQKLNQNGNFTFKVVKNAGHVVTDKNEDYINCLFN